MEHEHVRRALLALFQSEEDQDTVCRGLFRHGPIRLAYSPVADAILFWNIDYLTGVGDEGLGFIRLQAPYGLLTMSSIAHETFERSLTVLNYRLRNLIFDSTYYHQDFDNGAHKVLAGRGTEARDYSVGYVEDQIKLRGESSPRKLVITVGPEADWQKAGEAAITERQKLPKLAEVFADFISGVVEPSLLITEAALPHLRDAIAPRAEMPAYTEVTRRAAPLAVDPSQQYKTAGWSYADWTSDGTTLSQDQFSILFGDAIRRHPIRIVGPAGSGKTLLMQLMAMRLSSLEESPTKILFVTHNEPMELTIRTRFSILQADQFTLTNNINVTTLSRLSKDILHLDDLSILEATAQDAKKAQLDLVMDAFREACAIMPDKIASSKILSTIENDLETFADFIRADFSVAIKARNLNDSKQDYVNSATALGRLHGLLIPDEREVIYRSFQIYQRMLDTLGVLDTDDVALSMIARLSSPAEKHRRKSFGYDYIFVDEAQLFNENERRVFQYLSNDKRAYLPIAIALDEGQQFFGESRVGLALLGIRDAERESLKVNHRMSGRIAALSFQVISQSTDLFNLDFPDYTRDTESPNHDNDEKPVVVTIGREEFISNGVNQLVREARRDGMREIAIVCFGNRDWVELNERLPLKLKDLDFSLLVERGERPHGHKFTVLGRPAVIGGQEFDVVIVVGLESGVTPKPVENPSLQTTLEQQALRDAYVTFSRAKKRIYIVRNYGVELSPILRLAEANGLLSFRD